MADKPAPPIPFTLALLGAGTALFALSAWAAREAWLPGLLRIAPLLAGSTLVFASLVERLKAASWNFSARVETAVHTAVAATIVILTSLYGLPQEWDSLRLFFTAAFLFLLAGSLLILLPSVPRKICLTLWIAWHFSGMFAVFASIDPPNGSGPWLAKQMWTVIYRPYLQFLYLTNAYHFYSPDPGPPSIFWFAVLYEDGKREWVKLPDRAKSPVGMHYQRMLALPEHSIVALNRASYSLAERDGIIELNKNRPESHKTDVPALERTWEAVYKRRYNADKYRYGAKNLPIPLVDLELLRQYREPTEISCRLIGSVCKAMLAEAPVRRRDDGTVIPVVSAKAYKLIQSCLTPLELSIGAEPDDPTKYSPFYLGEHDTSGKLLDDEDPFLYWYLPRAYVPRAYPKLPLASDGKVKINVTAMPVDIDPKIRKRDWILLDCLQLHAEGVRVDNKRTKPKPRAKPEEKKQ